MKLFAASVAVSLAAMMGLAYAGDPGPQPRPGPSSQTLSADGITTNVVTPQGLLPAGQNQLPLIESDNFDGTGADMPNTLPSKSNVPFNLMGPVTTSAINKTSPKDDLNAAINNIQSAAKSGQVDTADINFAIAILEGTPVNRVYSGLALLHYLGPVKGQKVTAIFDSHGIKIGGNVNIHQVWYDNHIESDTAYIDPTDVQDVPWTVTYTVDVLNGGADDFAPFVMYMDAPPAGAGVGVFGPPHVSMDATFAPPMSDGTEFKFQVKMTPAKYYNLTYTWGWRIHPPRVQVAENVLVPLTPPTGKVPRDFFEYQTFCPAHLAEVTFANPFPACPELRTDQTTKLAAIAKIGELSPAKRMWQDLQSALTSSPAQIAALMDDAKLSFNDWSDRTHLPRGVTADSNADVTLFYVNNTMYGSATNFDKWTSRGTVFNATLLNGDHYMHGYMNVDFGGSRGWSNLYQSSGGPGSSHTFGRDHWWINAGGPWGAINIPTVDANGNPGLHKVSITLNFDAPERLKLYQFDPLHHDVAIFSLH